MNPPSPTPDLDLRLADLHQALDELRRRSVIDTLTLANWKAAGAGPGALEARRAAVEAELTSAEALAPGASRTG